MNEKSNDCRPGSRRSTARRYWPRPRKLRSVSDSSPRMPDCESIAGGDAVVAGRRLLDRDVEDHLVGRTALLDADADAREEAERLDVGLAPGDQRAVEGVAFSKRQLATDDEVAGLLVAGDVDALDIEALALVDEVGHVEGAGRRIAIDTRAHVGEGIALVRSLRSAMSCAVRCQFGGREAVALTGADRARQRVRH